MSDDDTERTEEASPERRKKARDERRACSMLALG